jgi:hypothetical protein
MEIVEIEPDILNIDSFSIPDFKFNESFDNDDIVKSKPTSNFGGGIELLMNVKNKNDKKASSSIDIEDITNLESELNNLASNISDTEQTKEPEKPFYQDKDSDTKKEIKYGQSTTTKKSIFGDLFGSSKVDGENIKPVTQNLDSDTNNLGKSTANMNETKTWDGYGKFNNIPINLEQSQQKPQLTKEEELREKFKYVRKLDDLEKKGISLSKRYNMESDLDEMIGEYETIIAEKEKSNAIKFQGKMMMACITGLEFLNSKFDPFDIKLDGWGEQINENIDDYDDIFAELHEKYKSKAKMSPELKLLFQLGGSAIMVHMSNTLFKSSMPGMDDIMRQNPELMKQFTQAAVNTMGQTNPGFGGFMNGLFAGNNGSSNNNNNGYSPGFGSTMPPNVNSGPPPMSVETKLPERSQRMPNLANRPDINSARGIDITNNEANPYEQERITRPEMRGPSITTPQNQNQSQNQSISSLLNGLKAKQLDSNTNAYNNESSTISIDDFKDLTNARIPTKSKRRQKSDKNIVSLDI